MSQTISYRVEDAVAALLNSVTGLNVYTSNRTGGRLFPYASVKASVNSQMLGNFTGVYDLSVEVNYSDTAAKISQEDFDAEYCNIFESFYSDNPALTVKLDAETTAKVYMARITSQTPTIRTQKRAWQRGLMLNIYATPQEAMAGYVASLDFSDHRNSMYIPVI